MEFAQTLKSEHCGDRVHMLWPTLEEKHNCVYDLSITGLMANYPEQESLLKKLEEMGRRGIDPGGVRVWHITEFFSGTKELSPQGLLASGHFTNTCIESLVYDKDVFDFLSVFVKTEDAPDANDKERMDAYYKRLVKK